MVESKREDESGRRRDILLLMCIIKLFYDQQLMLCLCQP